MLRDSLIAGIRTGIAAIVGLFITWLVANGVDPGDGAQESLNVALFGLATGLYNAGVIVLERKVSPAFGFLLGVPRTPAYAPKA